MRSLEQEMTRRAQSSLATNLGLLKELLAAQGAPQLADGKLRFGDYVANDDVTIVDKVKAIAGGNATLFMADLRVSTNVVKPDGSGRAIGTRLAPGAVHDAVFKEKRA